MSNKKYYLLHLNGLIATEYELTFKSSNVMEIKTTLVANSFECNHYKNNPKLTETSELVHYTLKNNILDVPEKHFTVQLSENADGSMVSNTGEVLYTSSIVELLESDEGKERVYKIFNNKELADIYWNMLHKGNEPLLRKKDGNLYFNEEGNNIETKKETTNAFGIIKGTTLEEVIKINGKDIKIYGFEWDESGRIADYNGGKLENSNLILYFEPTEGYDDEVYLKYMNDLAYSTNDETLKSLKLKVSEVRIAK